MAYKVIKPFFDLEDKKRLNEVGQSYPREGLKPSDDRVSFLVDKKYIKETQADSSEQEDPEFPKHTGGGYYELSNGEKVQGKDAAIEAEKALKGE